MKTFGDGIQEIIGGLKVIQENDPFALPYGCAECDGYGNIIDESGARHCDCKLKYFQKRRIQRAKLPANSDRMIFATFKTNTAIRRAAYDLCWDWLEKFQKGQGKIGILLWGPSGTGKTHLAVSLAHELLTMGRDVLWCKADLLLREIKKSFNEGMTFDVDGIYFKAPILVIDDLGYGDNLSRFDRGELSSLIGCRYSDQAPTIITTNLNFDRGEIASVLSDQIESRITAMCRIVNCGIADYRRGE